MRVSVFYLSGAIGSTLVLSLLGNLFFSFDPQVQLFVNYGLISFFLLFGALLASLSFGLVVFYNSIVGRSAEVVGLGMGALFPLMLVPASMMMAKIGASAVTSIAVSCLLIGFLSGVIVVLRDKNA